MNNANFKVGQDVILKIITGSNEYRRLPKEANGKPDILKKLIFTTVKSVSRKFITVDYMDIKFDRTDEYRQAINYSKDYELFLSEADALDADMRESLWLILKNTISSTYQCPYAVEQLEKVVKILQIA